MILLLILCIKSTTPYCVFISLISSTFSLFSNSLPKPIISVLSFSTLYLVGLTNFTLFSSSTTALGIILSTPIYDAISSTCNKLFIFSNTFIIGGIL